MQQLLDQYERAAVKVIRTVYLLLSVLFKRYFAHEQDWDDDVLNPTQHILLHQYIHRLHHLLRPFYTDGKSARQADQQYLLGLMKQLGLYEQAEQATLRYCRNKGWFDRVRLHAARIDRVEPNTIRPFRPEPRDVFPKIRAILSRLSDEKKWTAALVREGICRNRGNAQAVVALLERNQTNSDRYILRKFHEQGLFAPNVVQAELGNLISRVLRRLKQIPNDTQRVIVLIEESWCCSNADAEIIIGALSRERDAESYAPVFHKCHRLGLFDQLPDQMFNRPDAATVIPTVLTLLEQATDDDQRIALLVRSGCCRSRDHAQCVIAALYDRMMISRRQIIRQCWREGLFDQSPAAVRRKVHPLRPPLGEVTERVKDVLSRINQKSERIKALVQLGICPDEVRAGYVATALDRNDPEADVNQVGIALLLGIAKAYADVGLTGLLFASAHPASNALIALERIALRFRVSLSPDQLAAIRCDIAGLHTAFQEYAPTLWTHALLHAPIASEHRTRIRECLAPETLLNIIATLADRNQIGESEATTLVDLLINSGGQGLVDWRRGVPIEQAGQVAESARLRHLTDYHLGALGIVERTEIARLLDCLYTAVGQANITLSLYRVLNEHLYSLYRRRLKRRIPLSYSLVQYYRRLKAQHHKHRRKALKRQRSNPRRIRATPAVEAAKRLVSAFAALAHLEESDAAARLYYVWTYGGIGFLPRADWPEYVDQRLLGLLELYKLARIDGRLDFGAALQQVNVYAALRKQPILSAQLSRALLSTQQKPGRWNSGESEKIATVRKRAGLVLPGVPWLHRVWRLFLFEQSLPVAASQYSQASESCYLLFVIDLGSQLPLACWVSVKRPGLREVKLALFQSIWHPGTLDWPLRGIAEILQIPTSFVAGGASELHTAAEWLQTKVQLVEEDTNENVLSNLPEAYAIIQDLVFVGLDEIRSRWPGQSMTVKDVQDAVHGWLRRSPQCFGNHRPGLQTSARKDGFASPAFNTPAAGLLLPVLEGARTVRNRVIVEDHAYSTPGFRIDPGQVIPYRAFPYRYDGSSPDERMREAIFIEHDSCLEYLILNPEIPSIGSL
jgi:hypothetical protein